MILDLPLLSDQLVPEAQAIFGVLRRAFVVGAAAGSATAAAEASASVAASSQAAAASQQQAAAAQQQAAAYSGKPLPLGTVVSTLRPGCVNTPVGGVEYYYCAGNFYRAMFQGNQLG